jgi:hypothetical protein
MEEIVKSSTYSAVWCIADRNAAGKVMSRPASKIKMIVQVEQVREYGKVQPSPYYGFAFGFYYM